MKPGLVIYENVIANHANFIGRVEPGSVIPVVFFESTVPPQLEFHRSTSLSMYIYTNDRNNENSGIVRWRWPEFRKGVWQLRAAHLMPHYSLEIYAPEFEYKKHLSKPLNQVVKGLYHRGFRDPQKQVDELVELLREKVDFRAEIVQQAYAIVRQKGSDYRSDVFDDLYSTYSRDERLKDTVMQVWKALVEYQIPRDLFFRTLRQHPVTIVAGLPPVTLFHLFITIDQQWINPDPYVTPEARWGLYYDRNQQEWLFHKQYRLAEVSLWYDSAGSKQEVFDNRIAYQRGETSRRNTQDETIALHHRDSLQSEREIMQSRPRSTQDYSTDRMDYERVMRARLRRLSNR